MSRKITDKLPQFVKQNKVVIDAALSRMANDVMLQAKIRVPYKEGNLQNSGSIDHRGELKYQVIFNKEYAAYQEQGARDDGSRQVKNYTTPGTGKDFLKNAGNKIADQGLNYIKQAINNIRL